MRYLMIIATALFIGCASQPPDQAAQVAETKAKWARPEAGRARFEQPESKTIAKVETKPDGPTLNDLLSDPARKKSNLNLSIINAESSAPPPSEASDLEASPSADSAEGEDPLEFVGKQLIELRQEKIYAVGDEYLVLEGTLRNTSEFEIVYIEIEGFFKSGNDEVFAREVIERIKPDTSVAVEFIGNKIDAIAPDQCKFYPELKIVQIGYKGDTPDAKSKYKINLRAFGHRGR